MKLKLFLLATSAVALASCSSDAVVEDQQAANAIQFGVTTGNASRAASYYCNNDKPAQFNVWAATDGKTYFENESFSQKGGKGNWTIDGDFARFWPSTEVSFFAVNNGKGDARFATVNWNKTDLVPTIDMTVKTDASIQEDLLYAYTKKTKTVADNKCVADLNFRHALSQVVFKAQNKNKNIYVEISEVQVANLKTKGTFKFPTNVTDDKALNNKHDQSVGIDVNGPSFGKWSYPAEPVVAATTTTGEFKAVEALGNGAIVNLTNNEAATGTDAEKEKTNIKHSLIVLPQTLDAWDHTAAPSTTGAYFKVKCLIKNVAAGDGTKATDDDVTLYNDYIYIPVNVAWEVGKKYIYTFVFSEKGHGGYDKDGNNVLIPIKFNVTVDDFAKGAETNVDADNGN